MDWPKGIEHGVACLPYAHCGDKQGKGTHHQKPDNTGKVGWTLVSQHLRINFWIIWQQQAHKRRHSLGARHEKDHRVNGK